MVAWVWGWSMLGCVEPERLAPNRPRGEPEPAEPTEGPEPDPEPPAPVGDGVACYLGPARDGAVCLDVFDAATVPDGYAYPAPLSGSAQYLAPSRYLDLEQEDPSTRLAPNFRLDEAAQVFKGRWAVVQPHAIERLQALRDALGPLVVNSGFRSPDYNAQIGGATWSRHMYGDAFDLDPVDASLTDLAEACGAEGAGYVGVYTTHIHCDWRDDPLSDDFFPGVRGAARFTVQPALAAEIVADGPTLWAPAEGWDEGEPLREWTAYDAAGEVVARGVGEAFVPPGGAVRVEVLVGRALTVHADLE